MIPTPNEYYAKIANQLKRIIKNIPKIQIADVYEIALDGEPILIFPAQALPSQKSDYKRMKHYMPSIGDKVILINNIIIGGWRP